LKVELIKGCEGCGRSGRRGNEKGLFRFRKISTPGAQFEEKTLGCSKGGDFANDGVIVGIPGLCRMGNRFADGFSKGSEGKTIENHG
jgi:hypothetical protein